MTPWATGDVITAERLNEMQNAAFIANVLYDNSLNKAYIDKSYSEIKSAIQNGIRVYLLTDNSEDNYTDINCSAVDQITETTTGNNTMIYKIETKSRVFESDDPNGYMYVYA